MRAILFSLIVWLPMLATAQQVEAYLSQRWLELGEPLRLVLAVRGMQPAATPEFPEIEGLAFGARSVNVRSEGSGRSWIYEQEYLPQQTGTFVFPSVVVPFQGEMLSVRPGLITVRPASSLPADMEPAPVQPRLIWEPDSQVVPLGGFQRSVLYLEIEASHREELAWDLGALAELADSLRRSPVGQWLLADSLLADPEPVASPQPGWLRFRLYEAWWACQQVGQQLVPAAHLRMERMWLPRQRFRGGRGPAAYWEDEFVPVPELSWQTQGNLPNGPRPVAAPGPVSINAAWDQTQLQTGTPFRLQVQLRGPVVMGLVPAPAHSFPADLIVKGPVGHIRYERTPQGLIGYKTLDYLLYASDPGPLELGNMKMFRRDFSSQNIDSALLELPSLRITGSPIPQLREEHQLDRFYEGRFEQTSSWLPRLATLRILAYVLVLASLGVLGVVIHRHRLHLQAIRRESLRAKRNPGH